MIEDPTVPVSTQTPDPRDPAEKVKTFPTSPGVYLMKDAAGNVIQRIFKFRTCTLDIKSTEDRWRWFRPCLLHSIRRCTAPCNFRVGRDEYRRQIKKLIFVLEGKRDRLIRRMEREMRAASE